MKLFLQKKKDSRRDLRNQQSLSWLESNWWWIATIYLSTVAIIVWVLKVNFNCGNGIDWLTVIVAILPVAPVILKVFPISEIKGVKFGRPEQTTVSGNEGVSHVTDQQEFNLRDINSLEAAQNSISRGDLAAAENILLPVIRSDANNISAATMLGLIYGEGPNRDFDKSIFFSRLALFLDSNNFAAWMNLGLALKHRPIEVATEWQKALECFKRTYQILEGTRNPVLVIERGKSHFFAALMHEMLSQGNEYVQELKLAHKDLVQYPNLQPNWLNDVSNRLNNLEKKE